MNKATHPAKQPRTTAAKGRRRATPPVRRPAAAVTVSPFLRKWLLASCILLVAGGGGLASYHAYVGAQQTALEEQCRQAHADGDWPRTEALARQWASWNPADSTPWLFAAEAAEAMQNPEMAAEYLSRIGDDAPLSTLHALGRLQMEVLNQPRAAIETCLRTVRLHPRDSETHLRLLFYYAMTCQHAQVRAEALRAIEVGCDTLPTYAYLVTANSMTFNNGYAMNRLWLESEPESELYYVAATVHLIANRELSALAGHEAAGREKPLLPMEYFDQQVNEALERYPDNVELQATALARLCQAGDTVGVAKALAAAPPATADDARFWRFKGWYETARQRWPEAIAAYRRSLELNPFERAAQHELAAALRRTGDLEAAEAMQRRATLGMELFRAIALAPRIDQLPEGTMPKIAEYMELCGQDEAAKALRRRLSEKNS